MANNYNMSSMGYSVEVNIFFDTDLSQIYFNENFEIDEREYSLFYTGGEHNADNFIITVKDTPANRDALLSAAGWDEEDGAKN